MARLNCVRRQQAERLLITRKRQMTGYVEGGHYGHLSASLFVLLLFFRLVEHGDESVESVQEMHYARDNAHTLKESDVREQQ